MNKKINLIFSLGLLLGSSLIIKKEVKATIFRGITSKYNNIRGAANLVRSRSNTFPSSPSDNKNVETGAELGVNHLISMYENLEGIQNQSGLKNKSTLSKSGIFDSRIGSVESNIGALRSDKFKLGDVYGTYGANIDDFDIEKVFAVYPEKWYLQHSGYINGDENTIESSLRPIVIRSINDTEIDIYLDSEGNVKKAVHQGVGNWIKGSSIIEYKHSKKTEQKQHKVQESTDLSELKTLSNINIQDQKLKADELKLLVDELESRVNSGYYNNASEGEKKLLKTYKVILSTDSFDNFYEKKKTDVTGVGKSELVNNEKTYGLEIDEIDANLINGTINTTWWYLQYKDIDGNIKTLISSEKPRIKITNGQRIQEYMDTETHSIGRLPSSELGNWYTGQELLEEMQLK